MSLLTENQPSSGGGQANCKVCSWKQIAESETTVTEQCTHCKQTRTRKKPNLNEAQGGKKLLLEG